MLLTGIHATTLVNGIYATTLVTTDVLVKTVSITTSSLYQLVKFISNTKHFNLKDIHDTLEILDLVYTLNVIDKLVVELDKKSMLKSIKIALLGVTEILQKIHNELDGIKIAYEVHQKKYFHKWRSFECKCNIDTITKHKKILDSRYDVLIKLLMIYRK